MATSNREQRAKRDTGKPRLDLIPWPAVLGVARVMEHGLRKYEPHSWRFGTLEDTRLVAAAMRHLIAWLGGADQDAESGLPHLDHASANVLMLSSRIALGVRVDDRFRDVPLDTGEPYVEPAGEPVSLSSSVVAYTERCSTVPAKRGNGAMVSSGAIGGGYDLTDGDA